LPQNAPLPTIIDIEASGFGRGSYPIEIGFVTAEGTTYCTLIRPEPGWQHWDEGAGSVHGISRPLLDEHGKKAQEVAWQINEQLRGQDVYSDGWANDYSWLGMLFDSVNSFPAFRLKNIRELLSDDEAARWHELKSRLESELALRRHRASSDAKLIQETLRLMKSVTPPPAGE
jgi:hypothetical protein